MRRLFARFSRNRLATLGLVLVVVVVAGTLLLPWLVPWDPVEMSPQRLSGPSATHWLGTDQFGRDLLSRIAHGGEISLLVGASVTLLAMTGGILIGCASGYLGGWTDAVLMRCMDALMAFPGILLALALVTALDPGLVSVIIALGIVAVPRFARVVRGSVLQRKEQDYVLAARALGSRRLRILVREILPNCAGVVIVQATLTLPAAILGEAGLSFLGLGTPPPTPSWGRMLHEARGYMEVAPSGAVFVGLVIFATVLGFNLLGDGLRDLLDPRLRGRPAR